MSDTPNMEFDCPQCQARLQVGETAAGKRIRCPTCATIIDAPASTGIAEQPSRPEHPAFVPSSDSDDRPSRRDDDDYPDLRPLRRRTSPLGAYVIAPAVCMLIVAFIGFGFNLFGCVFALVAEPQQPDPLAPPILQELARNSHGPIAASVKGSLRSCLFLPSSAPFK